MLSKKINKSSQPLVHKIGVEIAASIFEGL